MNVVNIPTPCPEKISGMTQTGEGFYCGSCAKTVVDFRNKTNEEIFAAIQANRSGSVCGIVKTKQLSVRRNFAFHTIRFAAALLLVFGSVLFQSCGDGETTGKICDTSAQGRRMDSLAREQMLQQAKADSIAGLDSSHHFMVGELESPLPPPPVKSDDTSKVQIVTPQQ